MTKVLPKDLTSYDLLKTLAVILMIIDHVGVYFFPDELWWRAVGRLSAPIWLFLIGYARSRDIPPKLWGGALVLIGTGALVSPAFFPFTILVGMMAARRWMDKAAGFMFASTERLIIGLGIVSVLMIPSHLFVEYGLLCLLIPLFGYLRRWNAARKILPGVHVLGFAGFTLASYVFMNVIGFEFSDVQKYTMIAGLVCVFALLYSFKPATHSKLSAVVPAPVAGLIKLCGRRTLEIYVLHLLLFKIGASALGVPGFGLFEWSWY